MATTNFLAPGIPTNLMSGLFQNVVAGSRATLSIDKGPTYGSLSIFYTKNGTPATMAQFLADITEIRLYLNGKEYWRVSATQLAMLWSYYKVAIDPGYIPLLFERPWLNTPFAQDVFMMGTADLQSIAFEVDIAAGAGANLKMEMLSEYFSVSQALGDFVCLRQFNQPGPSGAGVYNVLHLERGKYLLLAAHFGTANVNKIVVNAETRDRFNLTRTQHHAQLRRWSRVPQSGWTHIDWSYRNRAVDGLWLDLQSLRMDLDLTMAGGFPMLLERVENMGGSVGILTPAK
jgi:hypothetical protein